MSLYGSILVFVLVSILLCLALSGLLVGSLRGTNLVLLVFPKRVIRELFDILSFASVNLGSGFVRAIGFEPFLRLLLLHLMFTFEIIVGEEQDVRVEGAQKEERVDIFVE